MPKHVFTEESLQCQKERFLEIHGEAYEVKPKARQAIYKAIHLALNRGITELTAKTNSAIGTSGDSSLLAETQEFLSSISTRRAKSLLRVK